MGDSSWLDDRLSHQDYNDWVKGILIFRELKTGLVPFLDDKVRDLQQYVLRHVPASSVSCILCTGEQLRKGKYVCPSGICTTILQDINTEYTHHPPGTVKLVNTHNQAWCDTARYWEIAKAYISTPGYAIKMSAAETDCVGLLTILINCTWIQNFLAVDPAVFQQIKDVRNAMMHSEDSTMSSGTLDDLFDRCVKVLQDSRYFAANFTAQGALARIREIKDKTLTLSGIDLPGVMFIKDEVNAHQEKNTEAIGNLEARSAALETDSQNMKVWQQLAEKRMEELAKQQTKQQQEMSQLGTQVKLQRTEHQHEMSLFGTNVLQLHTLAKRQRYSKPKGHRYEQQQEIAQLGTNVSKLDTRVKRKRTEHQQAISQLDAHISNLEVRKSTESSHMTEDSLLLLYPELKDKLRRDQCKAIAKDITAGRPLTAEEKLSFQKMTKRRNLVDWVLKYVLNQKDEIVLKIFWESLCKHSPSLGQTLQETSAEKHELVKTERQPTTIQLDDLHFLHRRFNSKLVVDIIIDQLLSRCLITVEEHSSIQSSSYEAGMIKRLVALLQYDQEIVHQFKLITQSFRNASVAHTADWLVPLHALAKETLSCGKGLSIATYIFQKVPGIISPSDLDELYKLKDNSRDVIDRLLKHIYRHPRPEMFDVICYSLEDHDEKLYEHFLRMFFFKGGDNEKTKPVVNKDSAMPSGSGTDHLDNIQWSKHTLDVVIDHLLSSFCITVDPHSDIRETGSIKKLVELLKRSPQMIMAVNAILRHLDKIADTTNTGNKEITISVDFGDPEVNSQANNYMDSRCGHTLTLAEIGGFNINDVEEGSVVINILPLDQESLIRFRDMQKKGTILGYLKKHVKKFLPDDVKVVLSEPSIGVMEETTCVPVQSARIINPTFELSSVEVYTMENEPFDQSTILQPDHHKCIGSIRMFANELLSQESKSNSPCRGLVFA